MDRMHEYGAFSQLVNGSLGVLIHTRVVCPVWLSSIGGVDERFVGRRAYFVRTG